MAFSSPFGRGDDAPEIIDAEVVDDADDDSNAPIRRAAAVPEASEIHAVTKKSDRELAVRNVAVATAGGLVAGAATIAVAAVTKNVAKNVGKPTPGLSRRRKKDILQSQSFLIDVHVLKSQR